MKNKTHLIEVKETFSRYFRVEGKNAQECVDKVKKLCDSGVIDIRSFAKPSDGASGSDFTRNVKQVYLVADENDWFANQHSLIPADADEDEFCATCE